MADKTLVCSDCGNEFVFTEGEQAFYAEKGFTNDAQNAERQENNKDLIKIKKTSC